MTILKARVVGATGATKHLVGTVDGGTPCGDAAFVEIVQDDSGYFLLRTDSDGVCVADTWHLTLDEAKRQASFEYALDDAGWEEVVQELS